MVAPLVRATTGDGLEFIATALREWLGRIGVQTLYIEPGSPWGEARIQMIRGSFVGSNGYGESFNGKLRDEFLAREIFHDLREAKVLIEGWRQHHNTFRLHSSFGYRPPAPVTILPATLMPLYTVEAA